MGLDTWTYHSTYRGFDIEVYTETALDITSYRVFLGTQWWSSTSLATVHGYIDAYIDPATRIFIETYRGISIYYGPYADMYYYTVEGVEHWQPTLEQARVHIDTLLEEPPPEEETVTVYLNPPLHGATLQLRDRSYDWDNLIRTQQSNYGVSYFERGGLPDYHLYVVRFPPQTIGGITYQAAETPRWMFQAAPFEYTLNLQEVAVGIPTTLTLSAPDKAGVGEKFFISGILYETESSTPIPNQPINHSYNGDTLGSSTTGIDGEYLKEVSIPEFGVWTLKSEFLGTETLQASNSQTDATIATTPIEAATVIATSAITGLAMIIYGLKLRN